VKCAILGPNLAGLYLNGLNDELWDPTVEYALFVNDINTPNEDILTWKFTVKTFNDPNIYLNCKLYVKFLIKIKCFCNFNYPYFRLNVYFKKKYLELICKADMDFPLITPFLVNICDISVSSEFNGASVVS